MFDKRPGIRVLNSMESRPAILRSDIVGQRIRQVWQTPWQVTRRNDFPRFVGTCDVYVELESGLLVNLLWDEVFFQQTHQTLGDIDGLQPVELLGEKIPLGGLTIVDIVNGHQVSLGLRLSNSCVLFVTGCTGDQVGAICCPWIPDDWVTFTEFVDDG